MGKQPILCIFSYYMFIYGSYFMHIFILYVYLWFKGLLGELSPLWGHCDKDCILSLLWDIVIMIVFLRLKLFTFVYTPVPELRKTPDKKSSTPMCGKLRKNIDSLAS